MVTRRTGGIDAVMSAELRPARMAFGLLPSRDRLSGPLPVSRRSTHTRFQIVAVAWSGPSAFLCS